MEVHNQCRSAFVSEHISRKELKQDKVRETFEHGAEAVLSHTRIASFALIVVVIIGTAYLGWRFYSDRQNNQAQVLLDDAMRVFSAPIAATGQPALPGELTYADPAKRAEDAEVKFAAAAAKYPNTKPGKLSRYYSALCLMDMDKLNQASEELNKLNAHSDKELSALAEFQKALIAERTGKTDDAARILRTLSTSGSILVPKPLVLLELAGLLRSSNPKEASNIYEQLKKDYPNSAIVDEADRGLQSVPPKS
jgi:predicted negative regulator of RcsB-dependent stress response